MMATRCVEGQPDCLFLRNPAGGQAAVHQRWCYNCESDAVCHIAVMFGWCANSCAACAKLMTGKRRDAVVTSVVITEGDLNG